LEFFSNYNFDMYQQYVSTEIEYMRESLASAACIMELHARHCFRQPRSTPCLRINHSGSLEEESSKSKVDAGDHPEEHLREAPESGSSSSSKFGKKTGTTPLVVPAF